MNVVDAAVVKLVGVHLVDVPGLKLVEAGVNLHVTSVDVVSGMEWISLMFLHRSSDMPSSNIFIMFVVNRACFVQLTDALGVNLVTCLRSYDAPSLNLLYLYM